MSSNGGTSIGPSRGVLVAIVVICGLVTAAITVVVVSGKDPTLVVSAIAVGLGPTIASLLALVKVDRVETKTDTMTEHVQHLTAEDSSSGG